MNESEIKKIFINSGMKKSDADRIINHAKKKGISVGRVFFLYAWRYYAWSTVLLLVVILSSLPEGWETFIVNLLFCMGVALVSLLFNPFVKNLIWSVRVQVKLIGK